MSPDMAILACTSLCRLPWQCLFWPKEILFRWIIMAGMTGASVGYRTKCKISSRNSEKRATAELEARAGYCMMPS